MAATMQAQGATGASPTWANIEGGCKYNRADSFSSATPTPKPTATGTNYSWMKNTVLAVTGTGSTSINNRRISMGSSPATGLKLHWKTVPVASYAQSASGNQPSAAGSNGAVPSGYTEMTTTPAVYDNTTVATSATGPNGDMAVLALGVDNSYAGGGGNAIALPSVIYTYDEF